MKLFNLILSIFIISILISCGGNELEDDTVINNQENQSSNEQEGNSSSGSGNQTSSFSSVTPSGFSLQASDYSITLSYTSNDEASNVNIYKGYCQDELELFSTIGIGQNYVDPFTGFGEDIFYRISFVNSNGVESNLSEIKSISGNEPVNPNKAQNVTDRPIGVHYADYHFTSQRFTRLKQRFTIHELPTLENGNEYDGGLYWNFYQGVINDNIGFYFGLQTKVYGDPDGEPSKGVIFSRWETRDISNYRLVDEGWGQSAGYEGDFIGIRKEFEWGVGTYEIELKLVESDEIGDWYGLFIRSIDQLSFTYIGSIRFDHGSTQGIRSGAGTWTEIYYAESSLEFPRWHVSIDDVRINNGEQPLRIQSRYFEEVWQSNQFDNYTNIFSPDGREVHFLMGPYVTRIHGSGDIVTTQSRTLNPEDCNSFIDSTAQYDSSENVDPNSYINFISDEETNFNASLIEGVESVSPGIDMVPGTIELQTCEWSPLFSDNQGNIASSANFSSQTLLIAHEGYLTNRGMNDTPNDNDRFLKNFLGNNQNTILLFPNFENEGNLSGFKSKVIDATGGTLTSYFNLSQLDQLNLNQFDALILFPGDHRFSSSQESKIEAFIENQEKKTIIIGLGWVWTGYYATGTNDSMPLNDILGPMGVEFITSDENSLTYGIREEVVFFPGTLEVIEQPIICSE